MNKDTYALLKTLTNKSNIKIVSRGNKAILYALRIAKRLGKKTVIIQDQGGWLTYKQFSKKLKLALIELKTDYGIINKKNLKNIDKNSVLLINSLTGYFAEQDMDTIYSICKKKNCLVINDISGSIGTKAAGYGDILVCSFGIDKPLNYGKGGLLAVKNKEWLKLTEIKEEKFDDSFYEKLLNLEKRLQYLKKINKKIKQDLKDYNIVHKDKQGINVIVKFNNETSKQSFDGFRSEASKPFRKTEGFSKSLSNKFDKKEKKQLEDYCKKNNYQYTVCPRYIRVLCDAISIEVKRC